MARQSRVLWRVYICVAASCAQIRWPTGGVLEATAFGCWIAMQTFGMAARSCKLADDEPLPENLALKYSQMDMDGNRGQPKQSFLLDIM